MDFEDIESLPDDEPSGEENEGSDTKTETADGEDGGDTVDDFDTDARVGALSKAQLADLSPSAQLEKWHELLLPVEVDVMSELDGTNLFFINAESLICNLILSKEVSWEENAQFLSLVYAIENQLHNIKSSGGLFRLVFFDCMKKLFSAAFGEGLWAFRQAFLVHCQLRGIDCKVFSSWYDPEWSRHVATWRPVFFLLADDAIEIEEDEEEEEEDEEEEEEEEEGEGGKADKPTLATTLKGIFHALILRCLASKTHVVLLRGLERHGNRIMSFTLEPDVYNSFIDHNIQTSLTAFFAQEDQEEEDEEEDGAADDDGSLSEALQAFAGRAGKKVDGNALLRSFFSVRFARQTLTMCAGQNEQTRQLMQLVVKALFLHEMLLRQIPMDKRSYGAIEAADWELFAEHISTALERYLNQISKGLGKLHEETVPKELQLEACDLFDGRMYRHIFRFLVEYGTSGVTKIDADFFGFQSWVAEELEFLWSEADSKGSFFPIATSALAKLPGITPPEAPSKIQPRQKPELIDVKSDFCATLWKEEQFNNVTVVEVGADEGGGLGVLPDKHKWNEAVPFLDEVKKEEEMDKGEAEKKLEEKLKAKTGKISARDADYQRKFVMKRRQLALRALHSYAKSLTGSDKLHPPIIMKEQKDGGEKEEKDAPEKGKDKDAKKKGKEKDAKEEEGQKLSKKHLELLEKRKVEEEEKAKEFDKQQMKQWEPRVDALADINDVVKLETNLLDIMVGFGRITDEFNGFPALASAFKNREAQAKIFVKALKSIKTALKKLQPDRLPAEHQVQVRHLIVYIFCMVQEGYNSFKKQLDGKGIKLMQEILISVGFPGAAALLFDCWKAEQSQVIGAQAAVSEVQDAGKDDKKKKDGKKGKEDKEKEKEKDKKDKKDKKSGKDDKKKDEAPGAVDLEKELQSYKVTKDVEIVWSGVGSDECAFQLLHMGPYLTRSVGNQKDHKERVRFKPDKWQMDLLDIVDDGRSALVVAPTASGKTFIGYYVMDQVLRADNDGVAVYVAPSKALVNQVSAEIYARFSSKTYPAHSKNELLGVFLREYNSAGGVMEAGKWRNCQVLVTIPHILEMLLLSPSTQDWVKRLRWVVFDEVHCIGEQEGGDQWEHCMQLIPCPFIALSATVAGKGKDFHSWLERVNKKKDNADVDLVVHTERWNDLYKYIWVGNELMQLHPFCCLIESSVRRHGLASDLTLTPQEMVHLWSKVGQVVGARKEWDCLSPMEFFSGHKRGFITKLDAREYERKLKDVFLYFLKENIITSEGFSKLVQGLQQSPIADAYQGSKAKFTPPPRDAAEAAPAPGEPQAVDFLKMNKASSYLQAATLFRLCRSLENVQNLPAIIFNFSRKEIEKMLQRLVQELKDQQYNKHYGTEEAAWRSKKIMEKRMADYNAAVKAFEEAQKMKASKNQEAKSARKDNEGEGRGAAKGESVDVMEDMTMLPPEEPIDIADEIDMEFSFHSPKALGIWQEDIEEQLNGLKSKGTPGYLVDALRRGIGMHHEGCKTSYRQTVEILFRRGFLRVVFATGTLALGINMPCRTTVFCGDSLELSGLMFRQMSGRAGRRGFDLLGQVVFLDMSFLKVQRLIASDLTTLTGEFKLSPTSLLRALMAWEQVTLAEVQDKELPRSKTEIARCIAPMFSLPFFSSNTADLDTQVLYQTRFLLEFLYREGFVATSGSTRGLTNMAAFIFETEPANFMLARFLTSGLLHEYLAHQQKRARKGDRRTHLTVKLTSVLAWFLYPRRLPHNIPKDRAPRKKHLPSATSPALPSLPKPMLEAVKRYNASVHSLFQEFAWAVGSTRKFSDADLVLPLSGRSFSASWDARGPPFQKGSPFQEKFIQHIVRYRARSPFSAIAGIGDNFYSPSDLASSTRNVLHLDVSSFPSVAASALGEESLEPTNSWMLDFMIHGKIKYLWEDNGVNATIAWKIIGDFKDAVKKVSTAMKPWCQADDLVLRTFEELGDEIHKYHMEGSK